MYYLYHILHFLVINLPAIPSKYFLNVFNSNSVGVVSVKVLEYIPDVFPVHEELGV